MIELEETPGFEEGTPINEAKASIILNHGKAKPGQEYASRPGKVIADSLRVDGKEGKKERSPHGIWIGNLAFSTTKSSLRAFFTTHTTIMMENITRIHLPRISPGTANKSKSKRHQGPDEEAAGEEEGENGKGKAGNRGFAYIDFSTAEAVFEALQLSELVLEGRKVLIKDANNFHGRPTGDEGVATNGSPSTEYNQNSPSNTAQGSVMKKSKRIFLGNLPFDTTPESLHNLYRKAGGEITHCQVATFEDSGKCKGYAWVEFDSFEASEAARRGWVDVFENDSDEESEGGVADDDDDDDDEVQPAYDDHEEVGQEASAKENFKTVEAKPISKNDGTVRRKDEKRQKRKKQRIFMNRLHGRTLRAEYAEDKSQRYKKRFGKGGSAHSTHPQSASDATQDNITRRPRHLDNETLADVDGDARNKPTTAVNGNVLDKKEKEEEEKDISAAVPTERASERKRPSTRVKRGKPGGDYATKVKKRDDARTIKPGAALAKAPRENGAIVQARGKKVVFD